jgi:RNA polymerase primary sigma factor
MGKVKKGRKPKPSPDAGDEAPGRREIATDSLNAYIRDIAKFKPLAMEDEKQLGRRIREGDQEALRRLVEANLRFVVHYAKRYRGLGLSFMDLIHEGTLGLMEAAKRFDPERNVKFITYAVWWIRQALTHALSTQTRAFSLPQKVSGAAARLTREVAELTEQLERPPTSREIAADTDMSEADVAALMQLGARDVSLSDRLGVADDEGGPEIGDLIESPSSPIEDDLVRQSMIERVRAALTELDDKEREVVELRFGLDRDGEMRTLQEIGEALHLSRERIRQIEARAKEKLRRSKRANELRSYLN